MAKIALIGECMIELSELSPALSAVGSAFPRLSYGGDTLNTAIYLARLGVATQYVTALGDDPFSNWMLKQWQTEGIDTRGVQIFPGKLPGAYAIFTEASGERSFYYWRKESAVRQMLDTPLAYDRLAERLARSNWVYLSGITLSLFDENAREQLLQILETHRSRSGKIAFDCNYRPSNWSSHSEAEDVFARFCALSDIALPTLADMQLISPTLDVDELTQRYHDWGCAEILIKLGAQGCMVVSGESRTLVPAQAVETVVDTTAAGDSFNAGYMAARFAGYSPVQAAGFASRLAAVVIQSPGAIVSKEKTIELQYELTQCGAIEEF